MRVLLKAPWLEPADELPLSAVAGRFWLGDRDEHAVALPGLGFRLALQPAGQSGFRVMVRGARMRQRGSHRRRAVVALDEPFDIGLFSFRIDRDANGRDYSLNVSHAPVPAVMAGARVDLSMSGWRIRRWSYLLALLVVLFGLVTPLSSTLDKPLPFIATEAAERWLPGKGSWSPGGVHEAHATAGLELDCAACHSIPFNDVPDSTCLGCHQTIREHQPISALNRSHFVDTDCASCHLEHLEPSLLVNPNPRLCLDCHSRPVDWAPDMAVIAGVSLTGHPPFKVALWRYQQDAAPAARWHQIRVEHNAAKPAREQSNLAFPHRLHFESSNVLALNEDEPLACADCHSIDPADGSVAPIRMEQHCETCHRLSFDPQRPALSLPHGPPRQVIAELQSHFERTFRASDRGGVAGGHLALLEREAAHQFSDAGCGQCHTVEQDALAPIEQRFRIVPVRLSEDWYPQASFDHNAHRNIPGVEAGSATCLSCHRADVSSESADVLMPEKDICLTCHTPDRGGSAEWCVSCHGFHAPHGSLAIESRLLPMRSLVDWSDAPETLPGATSSAPNAVRREVSAP